MTDDPLVDLQPAGGMKPCRRLLLLLLDGWGFNETHDGQPHRPRPDPGHGPAHENLSLDDASSFPAWL